MFHLRHYDWRMSQEHHISVPRTARYYMLGELSPQVEDVWFVCHGYGQLAKDFVSEFEAIADPRRVIVAPEALMRYYISTAPVVHGPDSRVGATWMTKEDREADIADYVGYLDALHDEIIAGLSGRRVSVTALGFSQGGATASRWIARGKTRPDRLIMWGSLLAADLDPARAASLFNEVKLSIVYGTRDQFAEQAMIADFKRLLETNAVPHTLTTFDGGHRMDRDTLRSMATF
jgi:predicted esterase